MSAPSLSLVLPCYNEEANADRTVRQALAFFDSSRLTGEVIAVEDGSRDGTRQVLHRLAAEDSRVRVVCHERNQGYGLAIRTGCDAARMQAIAFVDSDGQFDVADLGRLLPHLAGSPFVTGRRRRRADPPMRNLLGKALGLLNFVVLRIWIRDVNCGMKLFTRALWPRIRPVHGVEKLFNTEMFLRLKAQGIAWKQIDVPHYPRRAGSPTGAKLYVIRRMLAELRGLRRLVATDQLPRAGESGNLAWLPTSAQAEEAASPSVDAAGASPAPAGPLRAAARRRR